MNEEIKTYDVFISHSHHDQKLSYQIKKLLEAEGYRCWIAPDSIEAGTIWAEAIQKGISSSKVFLLIYSGNSNLSNQVWREITLAVANQLYIISYKCEDVPLSGVMKYFTATTHFIGFPPTDPESRTKELIKKIKEIIPYNQSNKSVIYDNSISSFDDEEFEKELNKILAEEFKEDPSQEQLKEEKKETIYDVFISHSAQDVKLANAVRERLKYKGMVCCEEIDRQSEDLAAATVSAIELSKLTLFLYTESTNASKEQLKELILSSNKGKIIFPVKMIAESPSSGLEYYLCDNHWLDIHSEPKETQIESIADSLIMFVYGDGDKKEGRYDILQNAAGEILIIINYKASLPDSPRLVFDGGDTALLYRNKDNSQILGGINEKTVEALRNVNHVLVAEVSPKTNDVVREYDVPIKMIKQIGNEPQEEQIFEECDYIEDNNRFDILKNENGELQIIIGLKKGKPENPRFVIDKSGKALLYRSRESAIWLEQIDQRAVDVIRKAEDVRLIEVKGDDIARDYYVPVRAIESLDV